MRATGWKLAVGVCGLVWGQCASAVTIGGFTFEDNAFADSLDGSLGTFTTDPPGDTLESVLTDIDENTGAFSRDFGALVQLGFTDNSVVNGTGTDLVLFELGTGSVDRVGVSLEFGGTEVLYDFSSPTGISGLNAAEINLDDFGIAADASISSVIIRLDIESGQMTVPLLTEVGALNSATVNPVPVPAAVWMFGTGVIGLVGIGRRRRQ